MKKTISFACALALGLALWPLVRAGAAPRCFPSQRFTVLTGERVQDKLTNLVWQQKASAATMSWTAAQTYCPATFRLPTVRELSSLVDLTVASGATTDQTAFPSTPVELFWTSTPVVGGPGFQWCVSFYSGWQEQRDTASGDFRVRCVLR